VAVGTAGTILTSPDGSAWTVRNLGHGQTLRSVAYGGGLWTAVGFSGTILTSPDGVTWTSQVSGTTSAPPFYGVTYGGGRWIAVSPNNPNSTAVSYSSTIVTSTNGVNWSSRAATTMFFYGPVAVGYDWTWSA